MNTSRCAAAASRPREGVTGVACGAAAFLIWGLSPVYWKALGAVPATEIILHRIVWSFLFVLPLLLMGGRWREAAAVLRDRRNLAVLFLTALMVAGNWLLYVWAITNGHMIQTSLGYYMTPLINVILGMLILGERLRPLQAVAVVLAGLGVSFMAVKVGVFPWISLTLGLTFSLYGLIRKMIPVGALAGLAVETLILTPPALYFIGSLYAGGTGAFLLSGWRVSLLLMGGALVTAFPLLLFTSGARRITYATVGFLQYIAPTCVFFLAVFAYGEPFRPDQGVTFACIWTALILYSVDSVRGYRQAQAST